MIGVQTISTLWTKSHTLFYRRGEAQGVCQYVIRSKMIDFPNPAYLLGFSFANAQNPTATTARARGKDMKTYTPVSIANSFRIVAIPTAR